MLAHVYPSNSNAFHVRGWRKGFIPLFPRAPSPPRGRGLRSKLKKPLSLGERGDRKAGGEGAYSTPSDFDLARSELILTLKERRLSIGVGSSAPPGRVLCGNGLRLSFWDRFSSVWPR
jgi:hypothetical protein